jgi:hypothetical protein
MFEVAKVARHITDDPGVDVTLPGLGLLPLVLLCT